MLTQYIASGLWREYTLEQTMYKRSASGTGRCVHMFPCHLPFRLCSSNANGNRTCTSYYVTECTTYTYARCHQYTTGTELPPVRPILENCNVHHGDYTTESVHYYVTFTLLKNGKQLTRMFDGGLWDTMQPGSRRYVERDIFGTITGIAEE